MLYQVKEAIRYILSEYKRVLKEIESWKSYSEELDEEITEISNKKCELEFEVEKLQKENELAKQALIRNCNIADEKNQLLKENEELKELIAHKNKYTKQLEKDLFENCNNYVIPVQKVKDKIEELKKNLYTVEHYETVGTINVLQELLEGRE